MLHLNSVRIWLAIIDTSRVAESVWPKLPQSEC